MGDKIAELEVIKQTFRERLLKRLSTLGMTPSDLALSVGSPRSTIAQLLNPETGRLPSVPVLLRICRALSIQVADLLPDHMLSLDSNFHAREKKFFSPGVTGLMEVARLLESYNLRDGALYHPRTIPEFLKPLEFLSHEIGKPSDEVKFYFNALQNWRHVPLCGKIFIDEQVLINLIDRSGIYFNLSRATSVDTIFQLTSFANESNDIQIIVCDRQRERVDPILILSDTLAISDYFSSLLLVTDEDLITLAKERFTQISASQPSLNDWLKGS